MYSSHNSLVFHVSHHPEEQSSWGLIMAPASIHLLRCRDAVVLEYSICLQPTDEQYMELYPSGMELKHGLNNLAVPSPWPLPGSCPHCWAPNLPTTWDRCSVPHTAPLPTLWACFLVAGWFHWNCPQPGSQHQYLILQDWFSFPLIQMFSVLHIYNFLFISLSTHSLFSAGWEFSIMLRWSRKKCLWLPLVERVPSSLEIKVKMDPLQVCRSTSCLVYSHYLAS